jgi:hypothetical protein
MKIDTNGHGKLRGYGTWTFAGPRGQQVVYSGWGAEAAGYLAATYGAGHWYTA